MKSQVCDRLQRFIVAIPSAWLLAVTENVQLPQLSFLITITTIKQIFAFSHSTYFYKDGSKAEEGVFGGGR